MSELISERKATDVVIPAKAGIQKIRLDARLRGHDETGSNSKISFPAVVSEMTGLLGCVTA